MIIFNEAGKPVHANAKARRLLPALFKTSRKTSLPDFERAISALNLTPHHGQFEGYRYIRLASPKPEGLNDANTALQMERLYAAIKVMPWGIMVMDVEEDGQVIIRQVNPKAEVLSGLSEGEIVGQSLCDVFASDIFVDTRSKQDLPSILGDLLEKREVGFVDFEKKEEETSTWLRLYFIPHENNALFCTAVIEDRTEEKIRESQYYQAQKMEALGQLAGGVAHDFNNILSIIDGYARMARNAIPKTDEPAVYLERIMQSVRRGSAITRQLLTFGRHNVAVDSVTDLGWFLKEQETLLKPLMDASVSLSIEAERGVYVDAATDAISQIMLNLCNNARDAMQEGGFLRIEAGEAKNDVPEFIEQAQKEGRKYAYLRVADTGAGMSQSVKARMFDPFFTTKDQGKGTGLGLSMVYGIVDQMKGHIEVSSKEGKGTAVTIYIPLSVHVPVRKSIEEDFNHKSIRLNGYTVLVAEDEPDLLSLMSTMLIDMGMNVIQASNGNEALVKQDDYEGEIDFLLTDVVMPGLNGVRLAEMFQALRPSSRVMFMSGYPANGQMARVALPEGAFLMPKPVEFDKLALILKNLAEGQENFGPDDLQRMTGQWKSTRPNG